MEFNPGVAPHHAEFSSLITILMKRAALMPDNVAFVYVLDSGDEIMMTYAELDQRARAIAGLLQSRAVPGERALLLYPPGPEFVAAFFGCLYSGIIAVPCPPPDPARLNRTMPRMLAIVKDARPYFALTPSTIFAEAGSWAESSPELQSIEWVNTDLIEAEWSDSWQQPDMSAQSIAFLQYTSGSTSNPKGVMVTTENLLANSEYIRKSWGYDANSVSVIWVPNFHDDGLVHGTIQPIYTGFTCVQMPASAVVQQPRRWLETISRFKATHSGGPNFIYTLCVRKVGRQQREGIDLSNWRVAYNAAEPIHKETLDAFVEAFQSCGFSSKAFFPSYGLAEATLLVSTKREAASPISFRASAELLKNSNQIKEAAEDETYRWIVGCGASVGDTSLAIVDPVSKRRCPPNIVGEIWIASPCIARGYWNQQEMTSQTMQAYISDNGEGPFLRTGDLGFIIDGELFVTGRLKDLIIIAGCNIYPQDIERTAEFSHAFVRPGCSAAFSVPGENGERLIIVAEIDNRAFTGSATNPANSGVGFTTVAQETVKAIKGAVSEYHAVTVSEVVLLKSGAIHKTSSGKIQRSSCRSGFLDGALDRAMFY